MIPSPQRVDRRALRYWLLTCAARAAGAIKEVGLALTFGTTPAKDALVAAWTAPAMMAATCNETLPAVLTPLWVHRGGHRAGRRTGWTIAAGLAAVSVMLALFPVAWIEWLTPGLAPVTRNLAITLQPWLAANVGLMGVQPLISARLNAHRDWHFGPVAGGLPAVLLLAALALTRGMATLPRLEVIAATLTLGNLLGCGLLLAVNYKLKPGPVPLPAPKLPSTSAVGAQLFSLLAAMAILDAVPVVERMVASHLPTGSLAAYDYADRLVLLVFALSAAPFTTVHFTRLAEIAHIPTGGFAQLLEQGLHGGLVLLAPMAAELAVFSHLITRCVLGWGQFNAASLAATAPVVAVRGAGLALDGAFYYLLYALYARGRAAARVPAALAMGLVNCPLAWLLARHWGLVGLAWAHLAGCAAAIGWIGLRRTSHLPGLHAGAWRAPFVAAVQAAALTAVIALLVRLAVPARVMAGGAGAATSWAWALVGVGGSLTLTALLASRFAPALLAAARIVLLPTAQEAAAV